MLIQQRFIKFPCFVIFFFVWLNDQKIMFVLAPKRHMTMHIWSQGNWQTTLDRKCCICCILGYITQTTPKTSPSEQIETPIIGDVPGYYVHSPLHWLLIYLYIRNKKLQLTNSVLNTRHDLYQLLNAIWTMLKCIIYI